MRSSGGSATRVLPGAFPLLAPDGGASAPSYAFSSETNTGFFHRGSPSGILADIAGTSVAGFLASGIQFAAASGLAWSQSSLIGDTSDNVISRASPNSLQFGASGTAAAATTRTELNKSVTGIADATGTAVLTVTIPNAAHSASILVKLTGSLGAGGAIGANEATGVNNYLISIARTAGVNAVAVASTAFGSANANVAGAATITVTAVASAVSGAVGATNTFTVNVTISHGTGASTNHTCLVYAQLMNANAAGITIV